MDMGPYKLWHFGIFTVFSVFKGHRLFLHGGHGFTFFLGVALHRLCLRLCGGVAVAVAVGEG